MEIKLYLYQKQTNKKRISEGKGRVGKGSGGEGGQSQGKELGTKEAFQTCIFLYA